MSYHSLLATRSVGAAPFGTAPFFILLAEVWLMLDNENIYLCTR